MEDIVYGFPWYFFPNNLQKDFLVALNHVTNGPAFTIGPFEHLNFETAFLVSSADWHQSIEVLTFDRWLLFIVALKADVLFPHVPNTIQ